MVSISFRADSPNPAQQQTNMIGLTKNGQQVLNKTNKYANKYDLLNTIIDFDNKKDNLGTVVQNTLLMPIMSNTPVGAIYTMDQYNNGKITKDDAIKIVAYNSISKGLSS